MYEIREREVPDRLFLTERRRVLQPELSEWIGASLNRLAETAEGLGGMAGPVVVVYYGQVNESSDGPVETCVPIPSGSHVPADVSTRFEPAHREAYTRLRKAQVEYPEILSAYAAVGQWIDAEGRAAAGAPREVYFTDWSAAGPDDEVCDIAVPVE
jgi:hypothetical protein